MPKAMEHPGFLLIMTYSKHVTNCREYNAFVSTSSKPISHIYYVAVEAILAVKTKSPQISVPQQNRNLLLVHILCTYLVRQLSAKW